MKNDEKFVSLELSDKAADRLCKISGTDPFDRPAGTVEIPKHYNGHTFTSKQLNALSSGKLIKCPMKNTQMDNASHLMLKPNRKTGSYQLSIASKKEIAAAKELDLAERRIARRAEKQINQPNVPVMQAEKTNDREMSL